jgi:RHS repeat-associated protein
MSGPGGGSAGLGFRWFNRGQEAEADTGRGEGAMILGRTRHTGTGGRRGRLTYVWFALVACLWAHPGFAQEPIVEYYHLDATGSVRAVTNQSGAVIRTHDYFAFGEGDGTVAGQTTVRFTGKERDTESGLDYFGARYYGSRTGRFTTVDPVNTLRESLVEPQRWNRYAYALNNPLRYKDPDGQETNPVTGLAGIKSSQLVNPPANPRRGEFGKTRSSSNWNGGDHNGVDIKAEVGTPLFAPISGKVTVNENALGGKVLFITGVHDGHEVKIGMAHLSEIMVKDGDMVTEGQADIARSGKTGNAKNLPDDETHVHLTVRIDGNSKPISPKEHFEKYPPTR